jgi:hypothetical protein
MLRRNVILTLKNTRSMKFISSLFFCIWTIWVKGQHASPSRIPIAKVDSLMRLKIERIEAQDTVFNLYGKDNSCLFGCVPLIFDNMTGEFWFEQYELSVKEFFFNDSFPISRDMPFLQLSYSLIMLYELKEKPEFDSYQIDYYYSPLSGHLVEFNYFYLNQKPVFIIALSYFNNQELCSWIHINLKQN